MKIALFLKNDKIDDSDIDTIPIIVLHTDSNTVVEIEKDIIVKKDVNYLALWLLTKRIKEVYVMDIDPLIRQLFERLGVVVRKYDDMKKNPLLRKFISWYFDFIAKLFPYFMFYSSLPTNALSLSVLYGS